MTNGCKASAHAESQDIDHQREGGRPPIRRRGFSRHQLARRILHCQRGELRQRYREGQEDQLGALGLVLSAVVQWNTRYMDAALAHLRATGHPVREQDVARLSPLGFSHINFLGRYTFASPEGGRLRPLPDPSSTEDEDDPEG